jgi:hypothetical protein
VRRAVGTYVRAVVNDSWPLMREGKTGTLAVEGLNINSIYAALRTVKPEITSRSGVLQRRGNAVGHRPLCPPRPTLIGRRRDPEHHHGPALIQHPGDSGLRNIREVAEVLVSRASPTRWCIASSGTRKRSRVQAPSGASLTRDVDSLRLSCPGAYPLA